MMLRKLGCGLIVALALFRAAVAVEPAPGDSVVNFSLLDYGGKHYELRRTLARLVVLFFTGSNCPIARQSGSKLQVISTEFAGKGVVVWLINSIPHDDPGSAKLDAMYEMGRFGRKEILGDRYAMKELHDLVPPSVLGDRDVRATGSVDYRYIDGDFVLRRDAWLRSAVTRPGNPKVVHHVIVRARYPSRYTSPKSGSFLLTSWVPGLAQGECPPDTGVGGSERIRRLPARGQGWRAFENCETAIANLKS